MNERIQELFDQARAECFKMGSKPGITVGYDELEKFAELLEKNIEARNFSAGYIAGQSDGIKDAVKQCLFLCDQVDLAGADDCIDSIKDHFGVEE